MIATPNASIAAFQTRVGLAALDLTRDRASPYAASLLDAIADAAVLDAYAARDVLNHPLTRAHLSGEQERKLDVALAMSGIGAGHLSTVHMCVLTEAVDKAASALRRLLAH